MTTLLKRPARHKSLLQGKISHQGIRKLARRAGVKRISATIYEPVHDILRSFLTKILQDAVEYVLHARRKTLMAFDVVHALKRHHITLYGFANETPVYTRKKKKEQTQEPQEPQKEQEEQAQQEAEKDKEEEKQPHARAISLELKDEPFDLDIAQSVIRRDLLEQLRDHYHIPAPVPGENRYVFPSRFKTEVYKDPQFLVDLRQIAIKNYQLDIKVQPREDGTLLMQFIPLQRSNPLLNRIQSVPYSVSAGRR